jgi:hypothetical protein
MISKDAHGIAILDKMHISTKEIVQYLESLDVANVQILNVLRKKPSLPGYETLPWVINSKLDLLITSKLRNNRKLNDREKLRLSKNLLDALKSLKKLKGTKGVKGLTSGLEIYINKLSQQKEG